MAHANGANMSVAIWNRNAAAKMTRPRVAPRQNTVKPKITMGAYCFASGADAWQFRPGCLRRLLACSNPTREIVRTFFD